MLTSTWDDINLVHMAQTNLAASSRMLASPWSTASDVYFVNSSTAAALHTACKNSFIDHSKQQQKKKTLMPACAICSWT